MTSKLLLFEYSSFKISEAVGAQNFEPLRSSELVEGHIHQSLCDDVLAMFQRFFDERFQRGVLSQNLVGFRYGT